MKHLIRLLGLFLTLVVVAMLSLAPANAAKASNLRFTTNPPLFAGVGQTYTPTVASNSPAPITLTVAPASNGACVLVGGVVTFVHSGACQINADQVASGSYVAGHSSQSVVVY